MKRAICLLLCVVMVAPVFADICIKNAPLYADIPGSMFNTPYDTRNPAVVVAEPYRGDGIITPDSREMKILSLQAEIADLKKANETSTTTRYVAAGLAVWGIATFGATGGLYPLVTGLLFLKGAMQ